MLTIIQLQHLIVNRMKILKVAVFGHMIFAYEFFYVANFSTQNIVIPSTEELMSSQRCRYTFAGRTDVSKTFLNLRLQNTKMSCRYTLACRNDVCTKMSLYPRLQNCCRQLHRLSPELGDNAVHGTESLGG